MAQKLDGIYDTQPKLRVQGTDIPTDPAEVELTFLPALTAGVDYTLTTQATALILTLAPEKVWVEIEADGPAQALTLTSAKVM